MSRLCGGGQSEFLNDQIVKLVIDQRQRHFVDRKIFVLFFDHRFDRYVTKQGNLFAVFAADRVFAAANQHIGLDTDFAKLADRVLRWLRLQFVGRLQIGNQRQVHIQAVLAAHIERELADRFQERQAFDVAYRATDLSDHNVDVIAAHPLDDRLDFVGDVGNDLNGFAQKLSLPFFLDHRQINLAGGVVAISSERTRGEAFVVPEIQVGLAAVVQHVNFAVLVRAHRAGIDIDVGVQLLHSDPQPTLLKKHADRGAGEPLAERTDHAAGYKDVFRHGIGSYHARVFSEVTARSRFCETGFTSDFTHSAKPWS